MKIYIILALVALISAEEWQLTEVEEWTKIHKSCDESYVVSAELLEQTKIDKYPPKEVFEVVLCILRSIGVWDDSTGFSTDRWMIGLKGVAYRENISKQFLRESIENCRDKNSEGSKILDWAYRWFKCFKDNENLFRAMKKVNFVQDKKDEVEIKS